jgi:hypothetical protein
MRVTCNERIAVEAWVFGCVGHNEQPRLENGMSTDGDIERGLAHAKPNLSFEPLTMIFDQVHDSNWGLTDMSRDANDILELDLRRRVEDLVSSQSGKTLSFVPWRAALLCRGTIITATHYTNLNHVGCPSSGNAI